jgi:K319-like protein/OmpA family protein
MLRKCMLLVIVLGILATCGYAQGISTNASKNDWEEINFEFNSAVLSDGYPSLLRLAELLKAHSGYHVKVEGNTDVIGSAKYNEKLGLARATTVRDFLVKYGATSSQIEVATRGKSDQKYQGFKNTYSKTDVARWMNRRVVLTVTDEQGRTVSDGGTGEAIRAMDQAPPKPSPDCCADILRRLDKLDDIARMLQQLTDQNAGLRREIDNLKQQQAALEGKIGGQPKPLTEQETGAIVEKKLEAARQPRFSLLGANIGADNRGDVTFTGKGRFFAPFHEHFAFQAQAEYLYFKTQREGQLDFGLVDRIGNFQAGLFTSFKHVSLAGATNGGTLGQGALTLDYIFRLGRLGIFGTKGFLNNPILDRRNATFATGQTNPDGSAIFAVAPNIFLERYLSIVDQVGVSTTLGLWGNNYLEANIGYLRSIGNADRPGGTLRFIFPIASKFAFTAEGGVNETLLSRDNAGRAVFGFQFGNFMRPKEYQASAHPVPVDIPRVRYEVLTRRLRVGASPPIADAGPDQLGVPAGTITLNGSNSRDPNGLAITYQWVQEAGPSVSLSAPTASITTFQAAAGQNYVFRLTVRNTDNLAASARVRISTEAQPRVQILFFIADPPTIQGGQSSRLSWRILNADSATLSPAPGAVNAQQGNLAVAPATTTTYTLTARNAVSQDTANVTVVVQNPIPRILVCTAAPMTINQGESTTLFFDTINADNVSISPLVGPVGKNGSVVVTPDATTNFTITATNTFGSDTCSVGVSVTPGTAPRIVRFSAGPLTIAPGGTSTLVWQVENATNITITPDVGQVGLVGTQDVKPAQTTTYTINASNKFGSASVTATVTVTAPPPPPPANPIILSFTANPPISPSPGSPVVLTCLAQNANQVAVSGVGNVNASGQITVNPQATTTYVCVASNSSGQQASQSLTVPVTTPGGGGTTPVVIINSSNANCVPVVTGGSLGPAATCQTVVRQVNLDFTASTSPLGNTPLTFVTTSRSNGAAVLNPTSATPTVQVNASKGDYLFDVTVTDSKGNKATITLDVLYI